MSKNKKTRPKEKSLSRKDKFEMYGTIISLLFSGVALVISLVVAIYTVLYAVKEYEYKVSPDIDVKASVQLQKMQTNTPADIQLSKLHIEILEKNNLKSAFLINADNTVEELQLDRAEDYIETKFSDKKIDFSSSSHSYQYKFILLKSLDDSCDLYLVYIKSKGTKFELNGLSNIEVWGLKNGNTGNLEYDGERKMAEHYFKILNDINQYKI